MGKRTVDELTLKVMADKIRSKKNITGDILFPDEFISAYDEINNGIVPEGTIKIKKNGDHDVTNFANAEVNVPVGVFPSEIININSNVSGMDITNGKTLNVNVPGIAEKYGLTKARRITFNVSSANGTSTESAPLLSWTPEFAPKIVVFGMRANVGNTDAVTTHSSYQSVVSSFWIDDSIFPIATSNYDGRKAAHMLNTSGRVNVSRNNVGFSYSHTTGKIFLTQTSNCRIFPKTTTDGYYEILYWG